MFNRKQRHLIYKLSVLAIVLLLFIVLLRPVKTTLQIQLTPNHDAVNLGLVYVPVNSAISSDYQLGVDSGALITEVVPGSPAEKAGLKAGDVVLRFNSKSVDKETPLFGMMRRCSSGNAIEVEIIRNGVSQTIQIPCSTK